MNNQDKFNGYRWKEPQRMKHIIDECERPNDAGRPLLHSSPVEMTPEARARLISHLIQDDFQSRNSPPYPQRSTKDTEPLHLSASQQNVFPLSLKPKPVVPVYTSIVPSLRWCSDVESFPCHEDEGVEKVVHTCRCDNCTSSSCPSRTTSSSTVKRGPVRGYIATYCDQSTMTPKLTDASCNVRKSLTYIPDLSDPPSAAPSAFDPELLCSPKPYPKCKEPKCPVPILKKKCDDYCRTKKFKTPFDQEVLRDTDDVEDHCYEPNTFASSCRYFSKPRNKETRRHYCDSSVGTSERMRRCDYKNRKILYNEGICDSIVEENPLCLNSPSELNKEYSGVPMRNRSRCYFDLDGYIPYSHTGHSKYHHDCKRSIDPAYKLGSSTTDEFRKLKQCPFWLRQAYCNSKPVIQCNRYLPCCLPRKVITSEKYIDSYIRCNRKC